MTDEDSQQVEAVPTGPISQPQEAVPVTPEPEAPPTESQTAQIPVSEPLPSAPALTPPAPTVAEAKVGKRDLLVKARAIIQSQKHIKLEKILTALQKKNHITNDEVEKLLRVSDATATRYLSELVKEGKIKKVGKTGKAVTYTKP